MIADTNLIRLELNLEKIESYVQHRCKLPLFDARYTVHMALQALTLGMIRPFSIEPAKGSIIPVLGYSPKSAAEISDLITLSPDVDGEILEMLNPVGNARLFGKPMTLGWKNGDELRFSINVCPTIRDKAQHKTHDAFVRARYLDPQACRDEVYRRWLATRLHGAEILHCETRSCEMGQMLRRTQGEVRTVCTLTLPDAVLGGVLRVTDAEALKTTLRTGVGRGRAWGFGFLKLFLS
jgi:hypothetical protein